MNTKQWKSLLDRASAMVKDEASNWRKSVLVDGNIPSLGYVIVRMNWNNEDETFVVSLISFLSGNILGEQSFDGRTHKAAKWLTDSTLFDGIEIKRSTLRNNNY
jgi:hypothetical protein